MRAEDWLDSRQHPAIFLLWGSGSGQAAWGILSGERPDPLPPVSNGSWSALVPTSGLAG